MDPDTLHEAKAACRTKNAWLATVTDTTTNSWIGNWSVLLGGGLTEGRGRSWLGYSDIDQEGDWQSEPWKQPMDFANWATSEPTNSDDQNCIHTNFNGEFHVWGDAQCDTELPCYVCQKSKCEEGWTKIGDECVRISCPGWRNWYGAQEECYLDQAWLAVIRDAETSSRQSLK